MKAQTDYAPKEFRGLIVSGINGGDEALVYLAKAMRFMSMARPVDYAELDSTYEEGRALIQEHLADLVEYAERINNEVSWKDSRKIKELEDQLKKHKRARELQQLINKPDFTETREILKASDDETQERKAWLEKACNVSEKMRMDDWKEELGKLERELTDILNPVSTPSNKGDNTEVNNEAA